MILYFFFHFRDSYEKKTTTRGSVKGFVKPTKGQRITCISASGMNARLFPRDVAKVNTDARVFHGKRNLMKSAGQFGRLKRDIICRKHCSGDGRRCLQREIKVYTSTVKTKRSFSRLFLFSNAGNCETSWGALL